MSNLTANVRRVGKQHDARRIVEIDAARAAREQVSKAIFLAIVDPLRHPHIEVLRARGRACSKNRK
jgi:hypothetical protein